ncbi:putative deoxyribonuclease RhsA (plasmid) [Planctomyces sp. SH-PL62]|nr:putative deoxyribonuclease RhsA [Planctomyces sp. SH-PL62]
MQSNNQGTGDMVLSRIQAALGRLSGLAPLPYGAASGMLTIPGGAGRVDLGHLFLMVDWGFPAGSPADLPLVLRYKNASVELTEFGKSWSMPYHRAIEWYDDEATILTPIRVDHYERIGAGPSYAPLDGVSSTLTGAPGGEWAETQQDGTSYHYDATGALRTIRNRAGVRWTLTWDQVYTRMRSIEGPFGRRTTLTHAPSGMIRRVQDPGGRIFTFTVDANDNLARITTPALCVTSFAYVPTSGSGTAKNRMVARIDPLGNRTTFTYTLPMEVAEPAVFQSFRLPTGQITTLTSGYSPPRTTIIDPRGGRWTVTFDSRTRPVATIDPLGIRTSYQWDSFSSYGLTRVTDGRGVRTTFGYVETSTGVYQSSSVQTAAGTYQLAYGAEGRLRRVIDERGNVSTLMWDSQGNRTAVIDPYGVRTSYAYDAHGRPAAVIDGLGRRSTRIYDALGRSAADIDPLGNRTSYAYDVNSQPRRTVDQLGNIWTTMYDDVNRLAAEINPLGGRSSYSYDLTGRLISVISPVGRRATMIYGPTGDQLVRIDAAGKRTTYTYDSVGNLISAKNPAGDVATTSYDALNRPVVALDSSQGRISLSYDPAGNIRRTTNAAGAMYTNIYDLANRLVVSVDPVRARTTYVYDQAGNLKRVVDALGAITTAVLDKLNRRLANVSSIGGRTSYAYDKVGNEIRRVDPLSRITTSSYDGANRLISVIEPNNARATRIYDKIGRLASVVKANGQRSSVVYDKIGREIRTIDPLGRRTTYAYDPENNLVSEIDGRGVRTSYTYDAVGRVVNCEYNDGSRLTISYDANGRRLVLADWNGRTSWTYETGGQVKRMANSKGYTVSNVWDKAGRRLSMVVQGVGTFAYSYNATGSTRRMVNPAGEITSWSYDLVGREIRILSGNDRQTSFAYDNGGRLSRLSNYSNTGTTLSSYRYSYDDMGNKRSSVELSGDRVSWSYDSSDRLVSERRSGANAFSETISYDLVGNRILSRSVGGRTTYAYDAAAQIRRYTDSTGVTTITYDGSGNLRSRITSSGQRYTNIWDPRGYLGAVAQPSGARVSFVYDGNGYRVEQRSASQSIKFLWDNRNVVVEEVVGSGSPVVYTVAPKIYGDVISSRSSSSTTNYLFDGLSSVRALLKAGSLTDSYVYTASGKLVYSSGSSTNRYRFAGRVGYAIVDGLELYLARARFYDPLSGRFISVDPIGAFAMFDPYGYTRGNYVNKVDPSGLFLGWGYGNFCGWSKQAACPPFMDPREPVDIVDAACQRHDCCIGSGYISGWCNWRHCTLALCDQVKDAFVWQCQAEYGLDDTQYRYRQCTLAAASIALGLCGSPRMPWE